MSGAIERPGIYEVPFGDDAARSCSTLAGGVPAGRSLQAVLLGGAAGAFVTPGQLDLPLTFEAARAAGTTLGSGVVVAIDEHVDLRPVLMAIAAFFRDESCGQCVPCRVGTVRQEEALARLPSGRTRGTVQDELTLIAEIGDAMRDASICGLGRLLLPRSSRRSTRLGVFDNGGGHYDRVAHGSRARPARRSR